MSLSRNEWNKAAFSSSLDLLQRHPHIQAAASLAELMSKTKLTNIVIVSVQHPGYLSDSQPQPHLPRTLKSSVCTNIQYFLLSATHKQIQICIIQTVFCMRISVINLTCIIIIMMALCQSARKNFSCSSDFCRRQPPLHCKWLSHGEERRGEEDYFRKLLIIIPEITAIMSA